SIVVLELVLVSQVKVTSVEPRQVFQQLVAACFPPCRIVPQAQAEARHPHDEVAFVIECSLADQLEQIFAKDYRACGNAVNRLNTLVSKADIVGDEVSQLLVPLMLDVGSRRDHQHAEVGLKVAKQREHA